jgi:hypothetical protein
VMIVMVIMVMVMVIVMVMVPRSAERCAMDIPSLLRDPPVASPSR